MEHQGEWRTSLICNHLPGCVPVCRRDRSLCSRVVILLDRPGVICRLWMLSRLCQISSKDLDLCGLTLCTSHSIFLCGCVESLNKGLNLGNIYSMIVWISFPVVLFLNLLGFVQEICKVLIPMDSSVDSNKNTTHALHMCST